VEAKDEPKVPLEGLKPFTEYHILAYAVDKNGIEVSAANRFRTGYALPQVTRPVVSGTTVSGASVSFEIASIGGGTITDCSIQYSTDENSWTTQKATYAEGGIACNLTKLAPATKYFVRAYAKNSGNRTAYGETAEFPTAGSVPALAKPTAAALASYKVNMAGGKVTDDGQLAVTEYGFCWSAEQGKAEATAGNYVKITGAGKDAFEYLNYDLLAGTTYYVRAYAKNAVGIGYSEEVTVTTPTVVYGEVDDWYIVGKKYKTVVIGNQTWMVEDLESGGTTKFNVNKIKGSQTSMCPTGWHIPTQQEWNDLITETGGNNIASKVLRIAEDSYKQGLNSSGLSVSENGRVDSGAAWFWTSTIWLNPDDMSYNGYYHVFFYGSIVDDYVTTSNYTYSPESSYSVRCIKD
jgi:uncharacterized protein (TIGR02145 family)